jgi:DNA-binding protein H-NS
MASPTYRDIRRRIKQLEDEAELLRKSELAEVIAQLRGQIEEYRLTQDDLFGPEAGPLAQYRDPETGQTWSGFGRPPNWIRGKNRERYRVRCISGRCQES